MKQHPNQTHAMNWRRRAIAAGLMMVALLFGAQSVLAANVTWTGAGGDANWSTPANWSAAPMAGDDLVFPDSALQHTNTNDLAPGSGFKSIAFTGPASGYSINGNSINLSGGINADLGSTTLFTAPIVLTPSQTFTINGGALYLGPINLGSYTLTLAGTGAALMDGVVSGLGGNVTSSANLTTFYFDATYTGTTTISAGNFMVVNKNLDPASVVIVDGGVLQYARSHSTGPVTVNAPAMIYAGGTAADNTGMLTDLTMKPGSTLELSMYALSAPVYGQITASGAVDLGDATLTLVWGFTSTTGNAFTIINKTSPGPITGQFSGLAERATFTSNGRTYWITYVGGNGNDVVITDGVPPPVAAAPIPTLSEWALIVLSMMLASAAFLGLRRQR